MTAVSGGWSQRCHRTDMQISFLNRKHGVPLPHGKQGPVSHLNSPPGAACPHPGHEEGPQLLSLCGQLTAPTETEDRIAQVTRQPRHRPGGAACGKGRCSPPPGWVPRQEAGGVCWTLGRAPCSPEFQDISQTMPHPRASSSHQDSSPNGSPCT